MIAGPPFGGKVGEIGNPLRGYYQCYAHFHQFHIKYISVRSFVRKGIELTTQPLNRKAYLGLEIPSWGTNKKPPDGVRTPGDFCQAFFGREYPFQLVQKGLF